MFGVAPAFFFSLYSTHFTADDYIAGFRLLSKAGFSGYQAEIFYEDNLSEWESKANEIKQEAELYGLTISQMDVHFMIASCNTDDTLFSEKEIPLFARAAKVCQKLGTNVMTIPIGRYDIDNLDASETFDSRWSQFVHKITIYCRIAEDHGMKTGMEIVPGSILGNTDGLLRLIDETGCKNLGYNFDTGHAWASKEVITFIPHKLKNRIWGTHMKDNFSNEDLALPPGKGSIPWLDLITALSSSGYTGPIDLEINSIRPEDTINDYKEGSTFLKNIFRSKLSKDR